MSVAKIIILAIAAALVLAIVLVAVAAFSVSFRQGQFQQGLDEIRRRNADGDPNTTVSVVTLDLGANDLLTHLGSGECQLDPRGDACQARVNAGLAGFSDAFSQIVSALKDEMDD